MVYSIKQVRLNWTFWNKPAKWFVSHVIVFIFSFLKFDVQFPQRKYILSSLLAETPLPCQLSD